mgnify:CR=1 FL=1
MEREFELLNGDRLTCTARAAVFHFSGPRAVLSTAANGGGLRYDLTSAFNYCDCGRAGVCQPMQGRNLLEHQIAVAEQLGLDPAHTTGLDTAANLDNMVLVTRRWGELWITAAVSGGADVNALCAGDPASLWETAGEPCPVPSGTINIFLVIGQSLAPGAMAELMLTATEAKTAVLRDLMQGSSVSESLATGTGTDGMIVICGQDGTSSLLNAGKHFKLGELAALAVREATTQALFRQTGCCPQEQHSVLKRLKRFGITADSLREQCATDCPVPWANFSHTLEKIDRDSFLVGAVALYVHLADEYRAGLLTQGEADDWTCHLLEEIRRHYTCDVPVARELPLIQRLARFLSGLLAEHLDEQGQLYQGKSR